MSVQTSVISECVRTAAHNMCSWAKMRSGHIIPTPLDGEFPEGSTESRGEDYARTILGLLNTAEHADQVLLEVELLELREQYSVLLSDPSFREGAKLYAFRWAFKQIALVNDVECLTPSILIPSHFVDLMMVYEEVLGEQKPLFVKGHRVPLNFQFESSSDTIADSLHTAYHLGVVGFEGLFDLLDNQAVDEVVEILPTKFVSPDMYQKFDTDAPDIDSDADLYREICKRYPRLSEKYSQEFDGLPIERIDLMEFSSVLDPRLMYRGLLAVVWFEEDKGADVFVALNHEHYSVSHLMIGEGFGDWIHRNVANYVCSAYQYALQSELGQPIDLDPLIRLVNEDDEDETYLL